MGVGPYATAIIDPPWSYRNDGAEGAAKPEYSTMRDEEIMALAVGEIMAKDSVILMWGTWPHLPLALKCIEAWGFEYVTGFPWVKLTGDPEKSLFDNEWLLKPIFGVGFWVRGCSEFVLIARRGKPALPEGDFVGLISQNFYHSRKPENLYELAEAMPGPYVELFARRRREGWDAFGNEIPDSIVLPPSAPTPERKPKRPRKAAKASPADSEGFLAGTGPDASTGNGDAANG